MGVDEKVKLHQDGKPNVFRSQDQMVVVAVRMDNGPYESMLRRSNMVVLKLLVERALDDPLTLLMLVGA